ncbi:MAG: apolipoprotein N-acyltransferase [Bacteroidales bacterium]|nr:apolipoprotein N-acyltransferase [Bacteroidales bacterium]
MKLLYRNILALTSGLMLSTAWYEWGTGLLLLFGLIPLLILEDDLTRSGRSKRAWQVYLYAVLSLLVWNLVDTWWIINASLAGLLAAILVSTLFMAIPFGLYSLSKRLFGRITGYMSLILFWLAFEFAYNHGEISWPWLSLGNGFLFSIRLVQWYEITGIFGGTLWVLLVNILLYELLRKFRRDRSVKKHIRLLAAVLVLIFVPLIASLVRYYTYEEKEDPREVVVVQPNIDPYEKFNDMPGAEQTRIQIGLAAEKITANTDYVVCPETSITNDIRIGHFDRVWDLDTIGRFVNNHPKVKYVVGIMCWKDYAPGVTTKTSKQLGDSKRHYDTFNSAIQIDSTGDIPIYHKSKLVTGVEKMPYTWLFRPLQKIMLHLGGIFRSHGTMEERLVFQAPDDDIRIAPVICYESVFGEFVGDFIKKDANYIFVITNDGWWGKTPGYRQHNALSSLRAIETRRSIARSANTGISCFINQRGDVMQELAWWKRGSLRQSINANDRLTFYVKYGDYIGRFGFYGGILLLLMLGLRIFFPSRFRK